MECNGEDDSKGIRKRKAKLPLKEESRDNGEKKENPDETVSIHHKPILASISVGVLQCQELYQSTKRSDGFTLSQPQ